MLNVLLLTLYLSVLSALLLTSFVSQPVIIALLLTPYLSASAERSCNWLLISQLALSALLLTPYLSGNAERSVTDALSLSAECTVTDSPYLSAGAECSVLTPYLSASAEHFLLFTSLISHQVLNITLLLTHCLCCCCCCDCFYVLFYCPLEFSRSQK